MNPSPKKKSIHAFSLVEVVMALGIIAFGLTAMLGLLPVGLMIFRDSVESTVQTDVLRELSTRFQETPFDELSSRTDMMYYSEQSQEVADSASGLLGVTWQVADETPMLTGANGYTNSHLKTVQVRFFTRADRAKTPPTASLTNVLYVAPGIH